MKIAVFGWYGHNNAGDERIKFCLEHFLIGLGGIDKVDFFDLHNNAIKGKTSYFDHYDLVIIGGGGLILSPHNYHDFILGINTKIITAGISVETELKGNPKKFAQALIEKSTRFLVRDKASHEKLLSLNTNCKIKTSADLTFLEPYSPCNMRIENKIGINLLAKTTNSKIHLKTIFFLNKFKLGFSPHVINFQKLITGLATSYDLTPIPLYCDKQDPNHPDYRMNDVNFMKKYFRTTPETFNDQIIDQCELFLSMRLHGLVFGVQKGIPILTFSIYPKQINFMKDIGLENLTIDIKKLEEVNHKIETLLTNSTTIKEKMLAYRERATQMIKTDMLAAIN